MNIYKIILKLTANICGSLASRDLQDLSSADGRDGLPQCTVYVQLHQTGSPPLRNLCKCVTGKVVLQSLEPLEVVVVTGHSCKKSHIEF